MITFFVFLVVALCFLICCCCFGFIVAFPDVLLYFGLLNCFTFMGHYSEYLKAVHKKKSYMKEEKHFVNLPDVSVEMQLFILDYMEEKCKYSTNKNFSPSGDCCLAGYFSALHAKAQ